MCDCEATMWQYIRLLERRWELEWRLAGGVLADLKRSLPAALKAGACLELFDREDMRFLWVACTTWPEWGREGLLPLFRKAMEEEKLWDQADTRPFVRGPVWNQRALVELAMEWHGAELIRLIVKELRSVVRRIGRAERCWRLLPRILDPQRDNWLPGIDVRPAAMPDQAALSLRDLPIPPRRSAVPEIPPGLRIRPGRRKRSFKCSSR